MNNNSPKSYKISGSTFFYKYIFPTFWFGILATFFFSAGSSIPTLFIVMPLLMSLFGFFIFKTFIWDLADEVYDEGDSLLIRKGKREQRVFLSDIININHITMFNPNRVVISSRTSGEIGSELAFSLPIGFRFFSKDPIIEDLIKRTDEARRKSQL